MDPFLLTMAAVTATGVAMVAIKARRARLLARLNRYPFPPTVEAGLVKARPAFTEVQRMEVIRALRQYFRICLKARRRQVAMPSQAVDDAWHAFILHTRAYQRFCTEALGRYLHHTPAEAMQSPTQAQEGIRRAWRLACQDEGINPKRPDRLPLLFALDASLGIADGFSYALNCTPGGDRYCASHIGCGGGSGCGGDSDGGGSDGGGGGCGGGD